MPRSSKKYCALRRTDWSVWSNTVYAETNMGHLLWYLTYIYKCVKNNLQIHYYGCVLQVIVRLNVLDLDSAACKIWIVIEFYDAQ